MQELFPQSESEKRAERAGVFVRVAVERGIDAEGAGDGLTYRAGAEPLEVGQRVEVPLGRGNKRASGIVVSVGGAELLDGFPPSKVKAVLGAGPGRLPRRLVELARWMADYYVCPLGMVLATMMPAAVKRGVGMRVKVEVEPVGPDEAAQILTSGGLTAATKQAWETVAAMELGAAIDPRELATRLASKSLAPVNKLLRAGLLRQIERSEVRSRATVWETGRVEAAAGPLVLTAAQRAVADGIGAGVGSFSVHLLRGVTGSGKTEVYMQVLARVVDRGMSGLVLVPEISLTPQTAGRFIDRFSKFGAVAVLHSGLSAAERHRQWAVAASGNAAVVVGARSAIFAPLERLGLIIVDEEHATDYKQDQLPRYNGRDVAIKRAQLEGCPVVLGSATPSLESWANAKAARNEQTGKLANEQIGQPDLPVSRPRYKLWELKDRVGGGRLPRVEIVDLAVERRERPPGSPRELDALSRRLEGALRETLAAGGQAILLLNRRGFSSYICCPSASCGWSMRCEHCDASMVLHMRGVPVGGVVRCHHCLAEQRVPRQCPLCGKKTITLGTGTQKLEDELTAKFAGVLEGGRTMVRVDGDTMGGARDYFDVLARFGKGEIKVLLGTQMIAKGLDYPNVRLVGVVNADTALALPDFRAAERTFQLVSQVAGRTGRGAEPGLVIVQTMSPGEAAIRLAAQHDYVSFAEGELRLRRDSGLPPVTRMARIVVRDEDAAAAMARGRELAALLEQTPNSRLLGPALAPVSRIAGMHRVGLELICPSATELHAALSRLRTAGLLKSDAKTAVDVDPAMMM